MGLNLATQTRRASQFLDLSCGERDNREQRLPVVFFEDDFQKVEW